MKNSLTDAEIEFFAEEIKKDYVNVLKEFTLNPANQEEKLISDVTLFIEGHISDTDFNNIVTDYKLSHLY
jgi:hypothetical protein